MSGAEAAARLQGAAEALYQVLGAAAPTLTRDPLVVRAHELGRRFGALAAALREERGADEEALAPLAAVLRQAVASDPTGTLVLVVARDAVAPRLAAALARADVGPGALAAALTALAALAAATEGLGPPPGADEAWQEQARDAGAALAMAGFARDFGPAQ